MPTLDELNRYSPAEAKEFFLSCCGSGRWAGAMTECRPYWDVRIVFNAADIIWEYLGDDDRREALRLRVSPPDDAADRSLRDDLEYFRTKFGYPFVLAPPLPPPDRVRSILRERLEGSPAAVFRESAGEELRILRAELRRRLRASAVR